MSSAVRRENFLHKAQTRTVGIDICGRSKHSDCLYYFDHGYLEEEKSIIHSFTVTFGTKYLTGIVTSVPPYDTFSLIKYNIFHQSQIYKNHFENSNFGGM